MKCCSTGVRGRVGVTKASLRTFEQIPEGKWEVSHRGAWKSFPNGERLQLPRPARVVGAQGKECMEVTRSRSSNTTSLGRTSGRGNDAERGGGRERNSTWFSLKTTPPAAVPRVNRGSRVEAGKPLESCRLHGDNGSQMKAGQLEVTTVWLWLYWEAELTEVLPPVTCWSQQLGSEQSFAKWNQQLRHSVKYSYWLLWFTHLNTYYNILKIH